MILNGGFLTISSATTVTINNLSGTSSAGVFLEKATSCMRLTSTSTTTYNGTINSSLGVLPPDIDGGIIKEGTGSITLTNNGSIYTGGTQFNGGTLAITATDNGTSSGPLGNPTSGTLSFNTGTLQIAANFTTSKAVVLAGPGTIQVDPSFTSTFNSGFTGPGSFTKSGGGTLILSSLNLYTGNTFITGRTLRTTFNQAFFILSFLHHFLRGYL